MLCVQGYQLSLKEYYAPHMEKVRHLPQCLTFLSTGFLDDINWNITKEEKVSKTETKLDPESLIPHSVQPIKNIHLTFARVVTSRFKTLLGFILVKQNPTNQVNFIYLLSQHERSSILENCCPAIQSNSRYFLY